MQLLQKERLCLQPHFATLTNCRKLINSFPSCRLNNVLREANQAADALVQVGKNDANGLQHLFSPTVDLQSILCNDAQNITFSRTVTTIM